VEKIEQQYESLDAFIAAAFSSDAQGAATFVEVPDGITREDVLQAIRDYEVGVDHDFNESVKYDLIHESKRYPPKAILGLAARRVLGRASSPVNSQAVSTVSASGCCAASASESS